MRLSKFEVERLKYLISQANKCTVTGLGGGDAQILSRVLEEAGKKETKAWWRLHWLRF